jgi:hypothetical protein
MDDENEIEKDDVDAGESASPQRVEQETMQPVETQDESAPRSREEALAEVRQSLREEEQAKEEKREKGFFARLGRSLKKLSGKKAAETAEAAEEQQSQEYVDNLGPLPPIAETMFPAEPAQRPPAEPELEAERLAEEAEIPAPPPVETPAPEMSEQDRWRKDLFSPEAEEAEAGPRKSVLTTLQAEQTETEQEVRDLRQGALEDYTEEVGRPEPERLSFRQTMRRVWRDMRPIEKRILVGSLIVIAATVVLGLGALSITAMLPEPPPPTATPSNIPYPISISLPGGWVFPLNRGSVVNGKWDPPRAEWLAGTEISRWVALPWNEQLEAVIRTLKLDDPITVFMSNNDSLVYKVKSIEQVPVDNISTLASKEPSLLLVLSKQDSDTRWVVSAVP